MRVSSDFGRRALLLRLYVALVACWTTAVRATSFSQMLVDVGYFPDSTLTNPTPEGLAATELDGQAFRGQSGYQLTSTIPDAIVELQGLLSFDISNAGYALSGGLPDALYGIPGITVITVYGIPNFGGSISPLIAQWTELHTVWVNSVTIGGTLPSALASLAASLTVLSLTANEISGSIPSQFNLLTNLAYVNLHQNKLSGSIPSLDGLTKLIRLRLQANKLTGPVPCSFGELASTGSLTQLYLEGNALCTAADDAVCAGATMQACSVLCPSTGLCPPPLPTPERHLIDEGLFAWDGTAGVATVTSAGLAATDLDWSSGASSRPLVVLGQLPGAQLAALTSLSRIDITSRPFGGTFPAELVTMGKLKEITLAWASMTGQLPDDWTAMTGLTELNVISSFFEGNVPASFSALTNLSILKISQNRFSGSVPCFLNDLPLSEALLNNNRFCVNANDQACTVTGFTLCTQSTCGYTAACASTATCAAYACKTPGAVVRADRATTIGASDTTCCEFRCASFECQISGLVLVTDAANVSCPLASNCDDVRCCSVGGTGASASPATPAADGPGGTSSLTDALSSVGRGGLAALALGLVLVVVVVRVAQANCRQHDHTKRTLEIMEMSMSRTGSRIGRGRASGIVDNDARAEIKCKICAFRNPWNGQMRPQFCQACAASFDNQPGLPVGSANGSASQSSAYTNNSSLSYSRSSNTQIDWTAGDTGY